MTNYLNKLRKGIKETVDKTKQHIENEGGLEQIAKKAVVNAGGAVSETYAHVHNAMGYEEKDPDAAAKTGKEYVATRLEKTADAASKTRKVVGDIASSVKEGATTIRNSASELASGVRETIDDYAGPRDRTVKVGSNCYYIDSLSKSEIADVGAYLNTAHTRIPAGAAGRKDVLAFIATNTIKDYEQLQQAWTDKGQRDVNALTYLKD